VSESSAVDTNDKTTAMTTAISGLEQLGFIFIVAFGGFFVIILALIAILFGVFFRKRGRLYFL
jgi:hypothetical protein